MPSRFRKVIFIIIKAGILFLFLLIYIAFGWGFPLSTAQTISMLLTLILIFYPKLNPGRNLAIRFLMYAFVLVGFFPFDYLFQNKKYVFELESYVVIGVLILMAAEYLFSRMLKKS